MQQKRDHWHPFRIKTVLPAGLLFAFVVALLFYEHLQYHNSSQSPRIPDSPKSPVTNAVTTPDSLVQYGYQLLNYTASFIGPNVPDTAMRFAGNNLACINCHLESGQKLFSAPFIDVTHRYPKFMGRANGLVSIEQRINGCMQRSMNGKPLPVSSREMKAIVAYFQSVSNDNQQIKSPTGTGFLSLILPDRAADLKHGKAVFKEKCVRCHGVNGSGLLRSSTDSSMGYIFPPLWGPDSFNQGAGMHRVITAARFIKGNMPLGTKYDHPQLTDAEAYDVAAYINDQPRPDLPGKAHDYPDLTKKPIDCPYPPYADTLSQHHHQFGPFVMEHPTSHDRHSD